LAGFFFFYWKFDFLSQNFEIQQLVVRASARRQ
jgi:hypothetical protein